MIGDFGKMPVQQGWQCPICGNVYSPMTSMCFCCSNKTTTASPSINITVGDNPDVSNFDKRGIEQYIVKC